MANDFLGSPDDVHSHTHTNTFKTDVQPPPRHPRNAPSRDSISNSMRNENKGESEQILCASTTFVYKPFIFLSRFDFIHSMAAVRLYDVQSAMYETCIQSRYISQCTMKHLVFLRASDIFFIVIAILAERNHNTDSDS